MAVLLLVRGVVAILDDDLVAAICCHVEVFSSFMFLWDAWEVGQVLNRVGIFADTLF